MHEMLEVVDADPWATPQFVAGMVAVQCQERSLVKRVNKIRVVEHVAPTVEGVGALCDIVLPLGAEEVDNRSGVVSCRPGCVGRCYCSGTVLVHHVVVFRFLTKLVPIETVDSL